MARSRSALAALVLLLGAAAPTLAQSPPDSARARAQYERGVALLAKGDAHIPSPGDILRGLTFWQDFLSAIGRDHVAGARRAFGAALEADPAFAPAAVELGKLALASRDPDDLAGAAAALDRVAAAPDATAETLRLASEVALAVGDSAAAGARARAYATAPGRDASLAGLDLARAELEAGRAAEGWAAYTAGLDSLTDAGADAYLADLGPLSEDASAADWQSLPLGGRATWLRHYWVARAAAAGRTPAAVLTEHERRLRFAQQHYPRTSRRAVTAATPDAVAHAVASGLDDRGILYVRHGAPDRVVRTPVSGCAPHESWLYQADGGPLIYHFVSLNRANEYVLVADPLAGCGDGSARARELGALADLDGRYAALEAQANLAGVGGTRSVAEEFNTDLARLVTERRGEAIEGLRESGYRPRAKDVVSFYYDTYAFRGASGRTDLVAALAIPGGALRGREAGQGVRYAADVAFAVLDTVTAGTWQSDTTLDFMAPRAFGARENLRVAVELPVPPGRAYADRVSVRLPGQDAEGGYGGALAVPSFRGDTLMVSDLVLAEPAGHGWRRGGVELGLVPPRQYTRGPISLFYELYNLRADSTYTTRIRVISLGGKDLFGALKRLFTGGGAALSVSFRDVAHPRSDGTVQVLRHVDLGQLSPGAYRMEVETRSGGRTVRRETEFLVRKE